MRGRFWPFNQGGGRKLGVGPVRRPPHVERSGGGGPAQRLAAAAGQQRPGRNGRGRAVWPLQTREVER
jgi:hypothetical protein